MRLVLRWLNWLCLFPSNEFFPIFAAVWLHLKIRHRVSKLNTFDQFENAWSAYINYDLPVLESSLKIEHDRRDGIHDRAKSVLASASLASGLVFSAFGLWVKTDDNGNQLLAFTGNSRADVGFAILLAIGSISLILGAISAVASISVSRKYNLYLQNYRLLYDDNVVMDLKKKLVAFIHFEQAQNLIISNYSIAAFKHLRNGLIGLLLLVCWIAFSIL